MKVGCNDPCPSGSGKKYKQCCLKKQDKGKREICIISKEDWD